MVSDNATDALSLLLLTRKMMRTPLRISHGKITFVLYNRPGFCGGDCLYCFSAPGFTKSTTPNEDTLLARECGWNGARQLERRFDEYRLKRGGGVKCDFAVKGDSFARHDEAYLREYTRELYDVLNGGAPSRDLAEAAVRQKEAPDRCVTYKVEARPDQIDEAKCRLFMELGVTTVELGVQSLDDEVLARIMRGHGTESVRLATRLLRERGFEVCYQMMVGLPGSNRDLDRETLRTTLWREEYAPDAVKIYPCLLLDAKVAAQERLRELWRRGEWRPVTDDEYVAMLGECYRDIPRWVHVNRIQRIIPAGKIEAGAARETDRGQFDDVARCLWQRSPAQRLGEDGLEDRMEGWRVKVVCQGGERYCFEALTPDDVVLGYGRLDLPRDGAAMIRDVRALGNMLPVGGANPLGRGCQHVGIGTSLLEAMEIAAAREGFRTVGVRPSFGTAGWFEKRGYTPSATPFFHSKDVAARRMVRR